MPSFEKPFAELGQKIPIPMDDQGSDSSISWARGFTAAYGKPPEAGGKYVLREEMNQILYLITQKQIELERGINYPVLYDVAVGAKGYPMGARVYAYYNPFTCDFTTDLESKGSNAIKYQIINFVNLKKDNKDSPLVLANLFKTWYVDDGYGFGDVKFSIINPYQKAFGTPPGYLDLGEASDDSGKRKLYKIDDYPRIKDILNQNKLPFIKKDSNDASKFYIEDLRGCFPRLYANGSTRVDRLRAFDNIQKDAGRKLEGEVMIVKMDKYNSAVKDINQNVDALSNISCWYVSTLPGKPTFLQTVQHSTLATSKETSSSTYGFNLNVNTNYTAETKAVVGNRLRFDTTEVWGDSDEFRPHNFNVKMYLKL